MDTECQTRSCKTGVCGFTPTPDGTPTASQTAGDCKKNVCDGKGGSNKIINDDTDRPVDGKACTADLCSNGVPSNPTAMKGSVCNQNGGKVCDGGDKCVECVDDNQCAGGLCQANACVGSTCSDMIKDGNETDIDCGGPTCNPCIDGKACGVNGDCTSQICANNICQMASTCANMIKDGTETDVDCGGPTCNACTDGKACGVNGDCTSQVCTNNICQTPTSCTDTIKNGAETDVDCGGPTCSACIDGKACGVNGDCTNKVCTNNVCQAASCTDSTKNGPETDIDCGGGTCPPCLDGKTCANGNDCVSKVCLGPPLVCQAPTCTDTVKNGNETDTDCGGSCTTKCGPGKGCGVDVDCKGGICNQTTNVCDPSCTDGAKNGSETDTDCGGSCTTKCGLGKSCSIGGDCVTGICTTGVCSQPPQINGCDTTNTQDRTGMASVSISFASFAYTPNCIKVTAGTVVTFNGNFGGHPLVAGEVQGNTKIPAAPGTSPLPTTPGGLNTGTSAPFTMSSTGTFPYYCNPHATIGMNGAIFVVP
jgi:plastocyanin